MKRAAWGLLAAITVIGCPDGNGPEPGQLVVSLSTQSSARAIVFRVTGPGVSSGAGLASSAYQLAWAPAGVDTVRIAVFAPQGNSLQPGVIAAFDVADVGAAGSYQATVLQVAGPGYTLQSPFQFVLAIARP